MYMPNNALVLDHIDHCDKNIHRLSSFYFPCRVYHVSEVSKSHLKFRFQKGEIRLVDVLQKSIKFEKRKLFKSHQHLPIKTN